MQGYSQRVMSYPIVCFKKFCRVDAWLSEKSCIFFKIIFYQIKFRRTYCCTVAGITTKRRKRVLVSDLTFNYLSVFKLNFCCCFEWPQQRVLDKVSEHTLIIQHNYNFKHLKTTKSIWIRLYLNWRNRF